jgi:hypothetical protein
MKKTELLAFFEELLLKVRSGESLLQALSSMQGIQVTEKDAADWRKLKGEILDGRISAHAAISAHIEQLRREQRLENLWRQKSRGPLWQAIAVLVSGMAFFLAAHLLFPPSLRPGFLLSLLYLLLNGLGAFWVSRLLRSWKALQQEGEWLVLLGDYRQGLLAGHTLLSLDRELPRRNKRLQLLGSGANNLMQQQWKSVERLDAEGKSLSDFLKFSIEQFQICYEGKLLESAEKLGLKLMLPMLCCQVPAQFLLIFAPLWQRLSQMK